MKKVLLTCLAILVVFAAANTASAITCTVDQRPAATLLVPYFQVSYDPSGALVQTGPGARDVIVTIGNASAAPTIAHVSIWSRYSELVLDFNIALTGFDLESFRMSDVLGGTVPSSGNTIGVEVCQKNAAATVYPDPAGFLRVRPINPANTNDNRFAATDYATPAFGTALSQTLIAALQANCLTGSNDLLASGYITIDHSNYCTLSNPDDLNYVVNDAIGMENNLWGEIIFTSGEGLPTYGMSTVNLEADDQLGTVAQGTAVPVRTFYARYWNDGVNGGDVPPATCPNCGSGDPTTDLSLSAPWDVGYGDQREPLGLKWAARWFDLSETGVITSFLRIWRADQFSSGDCDNPEPIMTVAFFDFDENALGVSNPDCLSGLGGQGCGAESNLAPFETQQLNINVFQHPSAPAGWVQFAFYSTSNGASVFDQAWVDYSFEGAIALESILIPGTQLDPSTCNPLGLETLTAPIVPEVSLIPTGTGI
jgi:hypothetical protein